MGCGMSTEEKEGKARNEEIENQLKRDRMQQRNEIKMLLLGMLRLNPRAVQLKDVVSLGLAGHCFLSGPATRLQSPHPHTFC